MPKPSVIVKFLPRGHRSEPPKLFLRQFSGQDSTWGDCRFVFDPEARSYDWLVVYEDLPRQADERYSMSRESLACPRGRTILLTTEPSMVKTYGSDFLAQFGIVVTYQEPWAISHPNLIFSHAGEHWFYGLSSTRALSYDELKRARPPDKPKLISTVCSSKRQRHTLHAVPTDTLLSSLAFIRQRNKGAFSGGSRRAEGMSTEVQCALLNRDCRRAAPIQNRCMDGNNSTLAILRARAGQNLLL